MGTSLTGTKPKDTYDSLIKVGDNGPISGTAKVLSDGLGNDLPIAVSTSNVGVGTSTLTRKFNIDGGSITSDTPTLRISSTDGSGTRKFGIEFFSNSGADVRGKLLADNNGRVYLDDNGGGGVVLQANGGTGNVGIGTSSPTGKLQVKGGIHIERDATTDFSIIDNDGNLNIKAAAGGVGGNFNMTFQTSAAERMRVTSDGYLRMASGSGGIQFNGDTAAANALDDYEEGTFTPSISFGGASVGVTYFDRIGNYTKIGRQVFVTLYVALTNSGSSTGSATIEGLPFTNGNANRGNQAVGSIRFDNITYTGTLQVFVPNSTTQITFQQVTEAGTDSLLTEANFNGASEMSISLSYFV